MPTIQPKYKAIQAYYEALKQYAAHKVRHEGALETAFQRLLADTARLHRWTLLPKQSHKAGKKIVIPDGTLQDDYHLLRGFWEAKDADDDLDVEITKKNKAGYEKLDPWQLTWIEDPDIPLSYRVEKMKLSKGKTQLIVNPSLTLSGIPPEVFEYRLGNRSALDWVIDQYRVTEDARSGIKSDPNREDDEEYIVRLVGQVVRVSKETLRIVKGLPGEYSQ